MKKFKVHYTAYDNHEWKHREGEKIIEAKSKEEIKEIVENWSNYNEEFFVEYIEELE